PAPPQRCLRGPRTTVSSVTGRAGAGSARRSASRPTRPTDGPRPNSSRQPIRLSIGSSATAATTPRMRGAAPPPDTSRVTGTKVLRGDEPLVLAVAMDVGPPVRHPLYLT